MQASAILPPEKPPIAASQENLRGGSRMHLLMCVDGWGRVCVYVCMFACVCGLVVCMPVYACTCVCEHGMNG